MKNRVQCKSCGKELVASDKFGYCRSCQQQKIRLVKNVGGAVLSVVCLGTVKLIMGGKSDS